MTIELKNIGKSYDGNSWTLNDITTEIESVNSLQSLVRPDAARVRF